MSGQFPFLMFIEGCAYFAGVRLPQFLRTGEIVLVRIASLPAMKFANISRHGLLHAVSPDNFLRAMSHVMR